MHHHLTLFCRASKWGFLTRRRNSLSSSFLAASTCLEEFSNLENHSLARAFTSLSFCYCINNPLPHIGIAIPFLAYSINSLYIGQPRVIESTWFAPFFNGSEGYNQRYMITRSTFEIFHSKVGSNIYPMQTNKLPVKSTLSKRRPNNIINPCKLPFNGREHDQVEGHGGMQMESGMFGLDEQKLDTQFYFSDNRNIL